MDFSYPVFQVLRRNFLGVFGSPACNISTKFSTFCLFVFKLIKFILKFSIIGLVSGLKFSLLYKFSFFPYFSLKIVIVSSVVKFSENVSALSLKQDLVYSHQSLAEEMLLDLRYWPEGSYKIPSVHPSVCP